MIHLRLATPDDDATLRALLRGNPMPGWVSMAMTREPSFFAGAGHFGREWVVLGHAAEDVGEKKDARRTGIGEAGEAVGMYVCTEQPLHWNGMQTQVGYLGGLRIKPRYRHRFRLLKIGYASIPHFAAECKAALWYTAIVSENRTARRLLEAGLRGLPRYRPLNELVTLALPKARGRRHGAWRRAMPGELENLCRFHNQQAGRYQVSPVMDPVRAEATGAVFYCIDGNTGPSAVMALWNQQAYKQAMACAYRMPLNAFLPLYNGYARLAKRIVLPPPGKALDQTFLAFLAVSGTCEDEFLMLLEDALALCPTAVMSLGLHAGHRWLEPVLKRFRPTAYRTWIYTVAFDDAVQHCACIRPPDGRPAQPEVAVL